MRAGETLLFCNRRYLRHLKYVSNRTATKVSPHDLKAMKIALLLVLDLKLLSGDAHNIGKILNLMSKIGLLCAG